jgi:methionyl aminopeptidase
MTVETERDLTSLLAVGKIVALTLRHMQRHVRPGITTAELDAIGAAFMQEHGVRSAPMLVYDFPKPTMVCINEEAAHAIPSDRAIKPGDLVKIDITGELDGYYADSAITVGVPPLAPKRRKLLECARAALTSALSVVHTGVPLNRIGTAAEAAARKHGFNIVSELTGHGVGRSIHEEPTVPNVYLPNYRQPLADGLVLAVEPHVTPGSGRILTASDGWTLRTRDGAPVANFEHTIVVTKGKPIIVTAA